MSRRSYTLDVNPSSTNRVKVRCYETRPIEAGGNILLVQGQLDIGQFQALERLFRSGAAAEGVAVSAVGRYYTLPGSAKAMTRATRRATRDRREAVSPGTRRSASRIRLVEDTQPRAPGLTGPVIGPDGVVDEYDDYDALAHHHVERLLQRRRAKTIAGL